MNVIFQARAGVATSDSLGAGPVGEQLLDEVHGLADAAGRGEGAKITGAILGNLPGNVNPGEFLGEVYFQVGIGLVVLEARVEVGLVTLDKGIFEDQGFRLGIRNDELEIRHAGHHAADFGGLPAGRTEIGAQAVPEYAGLAYIQHFIPGVLHQVNARFFRSHTETVFKKGLGHLSNPKG